VAPDDLLRSHVQEEKSGAVDLDDPEVPAEDENQVLYGVERRLPFMFLRVYQRTDFRTTSGFFKVWYLSAYIIVVSGRGHLASNGPGAGGEGNWWPGIFEDHAKRGRNMEIKIRRVGTQDISGDGSDVTNTYTVMDNGNEFIISRRTHRHGGNFAIDGQVGFLYIDSDTNTVRRQVVAVGRSCGISIDADEPVEGLSPWAIRGVVIADQNGEAREVTITSEGRDASFDQPLILIDGKVFDRHP
jgi:hypothetical protein